MSTIKIYQHFIKKKKPVPPWLKEHVQQGVNFPNEEDIKGILNKAGQNFETFKNENIIFHRWIVKFEASSIIKKLKWLMRGVSLNKLWEIISFLANFGKAYRKMLVIHKSFPIYKN